VRAAAFVAAAACLLLACWSLAHHTTDSRYWITDTGLYEQYGDAAAQGQIPYGGFQLEYPPGALPVFVLPSLGRQGDRAGYDRWFDREMAVCMLLILLGVAIASRAAPVPLLVVAVSPLLLGPFVFSRFDAWPTALAVLALAALLRDRPWIAAVLLGAAISVKLWPAVLVPLLARRGWRFAATSLGVAAAIFLPFAVFEPRGLWHSFHVQLARPLQLESLGSALLIASHHVFGTQFDVVSSYGSQNAGGSAARVLALLLTVALVASLVLIWVRGRDEVASAAACVTALLAFAKVFSPQFVLWLVPFVALVPDVTALLLLVAALVLTQTWFPRHYWDLALRLAPLQSWELLARDVAVVALFVVLARRALRPTPALRPASVAAAAAARQVGSARLGS
jgi:uncharacterized membrane protein